MNQERQLPAQAVVFDMDGVLLDTGRSFTACVVRSAADCAGPAGLRGEWGPAQVEALRLAGGFNNDWDSAAAMFLLGPACASPVEWTEVCRSLSAAGGGPAAVVARVGEARWREAWDIVVPRFRRLYAGPRSMELYGLVPTEREGLYTLERPLLGPAEVTALGVPFGIFTGRERAEARLGLETLGLALPPDAVVCDEGPDLRKPSPEGLLRLARALGARSLLFVGDTVDDLRAARNAVDSGLEVRFAGVAPAGAERERIFREGGALAVAPSARQVLRIAASTAETWGHG